MSLQGRVALVTGGAGHIGSAIHDALRELGAEVAITDADPAGCRRVEQEGKAASVVLADLRDEAEVRGVVASTLARHRRLDILVHCAAYVAATPVAGWAVPFRDQKIEPWDDAMRVNLSSAFILAQEAAKPLAESGRGSIIFISSIYGMVGPDLSLYEGTEMGNPAAYAASKAGLLQLSRYLATVLAPSVRVNCITPGGVWRNQPEAFVDRYKAKTPLKRMAREEDFKGAVAYLASDLSSYVTGHNLVVDGGWTAW